MFAALYLPGVRGVISSLYEEDFAIGKLILQKYFRVISKLKGIRSSSEAA